MFHVERQIGVQGSAIGGVGPDSSEQLGSDCQHTSVAVSTGRRF
jgi:hypothetical protein